jgi:hypothetical protein
VSDEMPGMICRDGGHAWDTPEGHHRPVEGQTCQCGERTYVEDPWLAGRPTAGVLDLRKPSEEGK